MATKAKPNHGYKKSKTLNSPLLLADLCQIFCQLLHGFLGVNFGGTYLHLEDPLDFLIHCVFFSSTKLAVDSPFLTIPRKRGLRLVYVLYI